MHDSIFESHTVVYTRARCFSDGEVPGQMQALTTPSHFKHKNALLLTPP